MSVENTLLGIAPEVFRSQACNIIGQRSAVRPLKINFQHRTEAGGASILHLPGIELISVEVQKGIVDTRARSG